MKYMALRNRLRALVERVPGPHAVLRIEGGLPIGATTADKPSESPPTTTTASPARTMGKAAGLLKAAGEPSDT